MVLLLAFYAKGQRTRFFFPKMPWNASQTNDCNQDTWGQVIDSSDGMSNHHLLIQRIRTRVVECRLRGAVCLATWQAQGVSGKDHMVGESMVDLFCQYIYSKYFKCVYVCMILVTGSDEMTN